MVEAQNGKTEPSEPTPSMPSMAGGRRSSLWPAARHRNRYSCHLARRFCMALSQSERGVSSVLASSPDFPHLSTLYAWAREKPAFRRMWDQAREAQAEMLMQKTLDLAADTTPKNAHAVRVKFDIYRFRAAKVLPALYGDKPSMTSVSTSVALVVSPERLDQIQGKLESARASYREVTERNEKRERKLLEMPESLREYDRENRTAKHTAPLKKEEAHS